MSLDPPRPLSTQVLDRLLGELTQIGAPVAGNLTTGLEHDEMISLAGQAGLCLPPEIETLWGWRDGAKTTEWVGNRIGPWAFESFGDALAATVERREIRDDAGLDPTWWSDDYIQLVASDGNELLFCDTKQVIHACSPVYYFRAEYSPFSEPRSLPSIGALADVWMEALHTGLWRYTADGELSLGELLETDPNRWFV